LTHWQEYEHRDLRSLLYKTFDVQLPKDATLASLISVSPNGTDLILQPVFEACLHNVEHLRAHTELLVTFPEFAPYIRLPLPEPDVLSDDSFEACHHSEPLDSEWSWDNELALHAIVSEARNDFAYDTAQPGLYQDPELLCDHIAQFGDTQVHDLSALAVTSGMQVEPAPPVSDTCTDIVVEQMDIHLPTPSDSINANDQSAHWQSAFLDETRSVGKSKTAVVSDHLVAQTESQRSKPGRTFSVLDRPGLKEGYKLDPSLNESSSLSLWGLHGNGFQWSDALFAG
jgi:hypothetical protein